MTRGEMIELAVKECKFRGLDSDDAGSWFNIFDKEGYNSVIKYARSGHNSFNKMVHILWDIYTGVYGTKLYKALK